MVARVQLLLAILVRVTFAQQFQHASYPYELLGLTNACFLAVNATVQGCSEILEGHASFDGNPRVLGKQDLDQLCSEGCRRNLLQMKQEIQSNCMVDIVVKDNIAYPPTFMIDHYLYAYDISCMKDAASGEFCDVLFLKHGQTETGQDMSCSACRFQTWKYQLESPLRYDEDYAADFSAQTAACKAFGYSYATPTAYQLNTTQTPSPTGAKCPGFSHIVSVGDTCYSVADKHDVPTYGIISLNGLGRSCDPLTTNARLCLPKPCQLYEIQSRDTAADVAASYNTSIPRLAAWNPMLTIDGSNFRDWKGYFICVSAPGGSVTVPEAPAPTAAPIPTNAHPQSTKICAKWYTVKRDEDCAKLSLANQISGNDFEFLNPSIGSKCSKLETDIAYCVAPVGDVSSYPGYPSTSITSFTRTPRPTSTSTKDIYTPTYSPLAPGTLDNCYSYSVAVTHGSNLDFVNSCAISAAAHEVKVSDLKEWNPSLTDQDCVLKPAYRYCVQKVEVPEKTSTTSGYCMSGVTQDMIMPKTDPTCNCFSYVDNYYPDLITCEDIVDDLKMSLGMSLSRLLDLNGWLTHENCSKDIVAGLQKEADRRYFCIDNGVRPTSTSIPPPRTSPTLFPSITSTSTTATTSQVSSTRTSTIETPSPTQPGLVPNCKKFHFVFPGQSCDIIMSVNGITREDFARWNPSSGQDCTTLWANTFVCVAINDNFNFNNGKMDNWKVYDGYFESRSNVLVAGKSWGGKATLETPFTDFSLTGEITLPNNNGDVGFIFRASNLGEGADNYSGYYAGISAQGWVVLGRSNKGWTPLGNTQVDLAPLKTHTLMVRASNDLIEVFVDDMITPKISVRDSGYRSGVVGVRVYNTGATFGKIQVKPFQFHDFNTDTKLAGWEIHGGSFDASSGVLIGKASPEGKATLGTIYSDFTLEVDIVPATGNNAGVLFRASNIADGPNNYRGYYAGISVDGKVVIGRIANNWSELGSGKADIVAGKTYRLMVVANGVSLNVYLDGKLKIFIRESSYQSGQVGVVVSDTQAKFDSFRVTSSASADSIDERFDRGSMAGWVTYDGTFDASSGALVAGSAWGSKALLGTYFTDMAIDVDIRLPSGESGDAGLIFRTSDNGNGGDTYRGYYAGISTNGTILLGRINFNWWGLGSAPVDVRPGLTYTLRIRAIGDRIQVMLDRRLMIDITDNWYTGGLVGVRVYGTGATFDNLKILPA